MRDPRRCDVARKAMWQSRACPREAQGARRRGRRPRGRVHVDAREGRHWQVGWQMEGTRVSGPWLGIWGGNANALPRPAF